MLIGKEFDASALLATAVHVVDDCQPIGWRSSNNLKKSFFTS